MNSQGQISAQGILHLRNPNLGPNSGKRIFGRPNFGPEFLGRILWSYFFPGKEAPSKIHRRQIHLPKFTFQDSTQKSGQKIHIAPLQGHLADE